MQSSEKTRLDAQLCFDRYRNALPALLVNQYVTPPSPFVDDDDDIEAPPNPFEVPFQPDSPAFP
ncbi:hypothetical protein M405DRAFT_936356 [Rhizopogon salebrosus TDB-379]|nr:hypothetical protein M405DRAFT_936356 [Rhizopogon salebrosus TDB-379]